MLFVQCQGLTSSITQSISIPHPQTDGRNSDFVDSRREYKDQIHGLRKEFMAQEVAKKQAAVKNVRPPNNPALNP